MTSCVRDNGDQSLLASVAGAASDSASAWELVWADEFLIDGVPDSTRWRYDTGDACDLPMGCGWGNNELQYYTDHPNNARVENGYLIIEAHKEPFETREYTSARLHTRGTGDWTYGRFEIRAKLPRGRGVWAAIWMLPSEGSYGLGKYGSWPHSGEIDIMEHVGFAKDTVFGNTHTARFNGMHGTDKPGHIYLPTAEQQYHTYALEWYDDTLQFYVDDTKYHEYSYAEDYQVWPYDQPFHLLMNIAVGGNWGGKHGVDTAIWPQRMVIDYVRVYKRIHDPAATSKNQN